MIPKIIHYCWFGHNPLPDLALKCIASWKRYMPDFEIKEWNEDNFNVNMIPYTREAYRLKKYAFVSDFARMWILFHYGGIYFDTDVELIRPIDDILNRGPFMGIESIKGNVINVAPGLGLGTEKNHHLYKEVIKWYEQHHYTTWLGDYTGTIVRIVSDILHKNGLKCIGNYYYGSDICIYPKDYFCPLDYYTGVLEISPNTRSIHHYDASWKSKKKRTVIDKIKKRLFYMSTRLLETFKFLY